MRETPGEHPFLLATLPPSRGQIRLALGIVVALLVAFGVTVPFTYVQLPRIDGFIPAFETASSINDLIASALLFAQFTVVRRWALLILASGFLYTALIIIPHQLSFPGAFTPTGMLGAGLQSTVWLYIFWHLGSPLAVIGYALLKDANGGINLLQRSPIAVGCWSVAVVIAIVCGLTWVAIADHWLLPRIFLDGVRMNQTLSTLFGGLLMSLSITALALLWIRRQTVLDVWLMVMCCTWLIEATISAVLIETRFSLGWYAGRIYALIGTTFVLLVLLSETTTLYAFLARSVSQKRSEHEVQKTKMDAMAASIAHEVNQPLSAIVINAQAALRFLAKTPPNINEVRAALEAITSDGVRGNEVITSLRAMFKKDAHGRAWLNVNDLIRETLEILHIEIHTQRVLLSTNLREEIPRLFADRGQLHQVFVNLIMNAVEAMHFVTERPRRLRVTSDTIQGSSDVLITVEDSGAGIDTKDTDRIFEPFFTTKSTGTGIGLSICRSIIEAHGGSLRASASDRYGTIFHVVLPINNTE